MVHSLHRATLAVAFFLLVVVSSSRADTKGFRIQGQSLGNTVYAFGFGRFDVNCRNSPAPTASSWDWAVTLSNEINLLDQPGVSASPNLAPGGATLIVITHPGDFEFWVTDMCPPDLIVTQQHTCEVTGGGTCTLAPVVTISDTSAGSISQLVPAASDLQLALLAAMLGLTGAYLALKRSA